jgi:hypothetical protein
MEGKGTTEETERPASAKADSAATPRRRRSANDTELRYFLVKPGSSPAKPELGQEMASEGEALIEAFRTGQPFYMEGGSGGEWRQSCDRETGRRPEDDLELIR